MHERTKHLGLADSAVGVAERVVKFLGFNLAFRQHDLLQQIDILLDVLVAVDSVGIDGILDRSPNVFGERANSLGTIGCISPMLHSAHDRLGVIEPTDGAILGGWCATFASNDLGHANLVKASFQFANNVSQGNHLAVNLNKLVAARLLPQGVNHLTQLAELLHRQVLVVLGTRGSRHDKRLDCRVHLGVVRLELLNVFGG